MKRLVLVRHGNTFDSGEVPVYIGEATDLHLTEVGTDQGKRVGKEVADRGFVPNLIVAGSLQRQQETVSAILTQLSSHVEQVVSPALIELDYGRWEGLSEEEVEKKWPLELLAWKETAAWPASFNSKQSDFLKQSAAFLAEAKDFPDTTVVVTSNGVLRSFYQLLAEDWSDLVAAKKADQAKVKTGAYSVLELLDNAWHISQWNVKPGIC